jgi:hypothetical protein
MQKEQENKHDADSGNDGSTLWKLEQEHLIDPGNEHNHCEEWNTPQEQEHHEHLDADAGGDATGTSGPEPTTS